MRDYSKYIITTQSNTESVNQPQLKHEIPTNCGTKVADVLDNFFAGKHNATRCADYFGAFAPFTTPINSKCCSICYHLALKGEF